LASTGVRANSSSAAPIATRLGISVLRRPKRIASRADAPIDMTPITIVAGRKAIPTSSAS